MNRGRGCYRGGGRGGGDGRGGRYYVPKGRSPLSADHYSGRRVPNGAAAQDDASSRSESSRGGRRNSEILSTYWVAKKVDGLSSSDYTSDPNPEPCGAGNLSPNDQNSKPVESIHESEPNLSTFPSFSPSYDHNNNLPSLSTPSELDARTPKIIQSQDRNIENSCPSYLSFTPPADVMHKKKDPSLNTDGKTELEGNSGKDEVEMHKKKDPSLSTDGKTGPEGNSGKDEVEMHKKKDLSLSTYGKTGLEGNSGKDEVENSDSQQKGFSFDICEERNATVPKLKSSLLVKNRAIRNEKRRMQGNNIKIIRPGMFLLQGYISLTDQVKLVKSCRDLGRGPGGFYQPGYRDGAMLHLKMMCLGKNWDPETSSYGDTRSVDLAKPPPIPTEFQQLVKDTIQDCHGKVRNAKDFLPSMSPNICIINFYTKQGKLGLHQDKDESPESLDNGIPVVSISLGDSAEFLYGDERDVEKAGKVVLESGDVLIFGGKSRRIFHGVSSINPNTAPKALMEETGMRPGRLNLTFRQY